MLRLAVLEDFDFFCEIKNEKYNIFWTGGAKPIRENLWRFFHECIKHMDELEARKIYIICDEHKNKIGYGYLDPKQDECEWSVAIKQTYCNCGYGKASLAEAMEIARSTGFKNMYAWVREDNEASLCMFRSHGFKQTQQYKDVYIPMLSKEVGMYRLERVL